MPKFDSQNPAQTPSVVIGRALHFIGRKVRVWPEEEATAEEAYRYAIRHDILGRQDLSQAAGAAAEHERADAREPERGRVEPRVVRFPISDDDTCERMSTLRRGRKAPPRRRLTRVDSPNVRAGGDIASFPRDCLVKIVRRSRTAARGARKSRPPPSFFPRDSVAASARLHRDDDDPSTLPSSMLTPSPAPPSIHVAGTCTTPCASTAGGARSASCQSSSPSFSQPRCSTSAGFYRTRPVPRPWKRRWRRAPCPSSSPSWRRSSSSRTRRRTTSAARREAAGTCRGWSTRGSAKSRCGRASSRRRSGSVG